MAILSDLPNELLLSIIVDVSPLYIESLALSCKRIYNLCADILREHDLVRTRLLSLQKEDFLRTLLSNPSMALYPKSVDLFLGDRGDERPPKDLIHTIGAQTLQTPYTILSNRTSVRYMAIPFLVSRLLNVQKTLFYVVWAPYLLDLVEEVIEAKYDPTLTMRQPLPLG